MVLEKRVLGFGFPKEKPQQVRKNLWGVSRKSFEGALQDGNKFKATLGYGQ